MKKIIITYGLIAGVLVSAMLVISMPLLRKGVISYENGMLVGYTTMVISLSMIFFGIKTYRDQHQNGTISFGRGFKVGILITLVASLLYAVCWEIYYNTAGSDFNEWYTQCQMDRLTQEGASQTKLEEARTEMENWNEMYKNPLIRFGFTIIEILPVGLIITLISAGLLRKKEILPVV